MCGFLLLRGCYPLACSISFLFDATSSSHCFAFKGGQILGSSIIALAAALLHTRCSGIARKSIRVVFATFCTAVITLFDN